MDLTSTIRRIALALLATATASVIAPASTRADGPSAVVYVQSNIAGPNANGLFGFRRDNSGALTPLPGSPFLTGGAGISPTTDLGPYDSDSEIITNEDQSLLFTTNGGSDTIAVLRTHEDGTLTPVAGSPFPSGGTNPVSLALVNDLLTVVNKNMDPGRKGQFLPNYTTLRVKSGGRLVPTGKAPQVVDNGSSPTQALLSPNENVVFGCEFLGGTLRTFKIRNGGLVLTDVTGLDPAEFAGTGAPPLPLGLAVHPRQNLLYVGFVTINRVGVFHYSNAGKLRYLRSVPNSGKALCWLLVNKKGTRLYTSNTVDNSISVYDTRSNPGVPVEIQHVVLKGDGNAYQIALDPSGEFFYVVTQKNLPTFSDAANALHVLQVDAHGMLQEVPTSPTVLPVPEGTRPQGVIAF